MEFGTSTTCYSSAPAMLLLLCPCRTPALLLSSSYSAHSWLLPSSCPAPTLFLPCSALLCLALLRPCSCPAPAPAQAALLMLLPCSCFAPGLLPPCSCPAPGPTHPSLAGFIIISTLRLSAARREPPFIHVSIVEK